MKTQSDTLRAQPILGGILKCLAVATVLCHTSFAQADLSTGLVAYYPFNGNATDESDSGNNGAVHGATLTEDRFGHPNSAYSFDGIDNYISTYDSPSLNIEGDLTISVWISPSGGTDYERLVFSNMTETSPYLGYSIRLDEDTGVVRFQSGAAFFANTHISKDRWSHLAVTVSGTTARVYVDGVLEDSGTVNVPTAASVAQVIGSSYGGKYCFKGLIDDLRVYNRALTDSEIEQLYTLPAPPVRPGLQEQIPPSEYAALVDLYNSTHGDSWVNHPGWLDPSARTWYGVNVSGFSYDLITGQVTAQGHVTGLQLNVNGLAGELPESLGNLTALNWLGFVSNQLTGDIPASLGNLVNLIGLELENQWWGPPLPGPGNQLTGNIPESLGNLRDLLHLDLSGNRLTGSIPVSFGNLLRLGTLILMNNQLTGTIPENLGNLPVLNEVKLGRNQFTGSIPESFGNLVHLWYLDLGGNQLTGPIPPSLGNVAGFETLILSYNQLTGPIPSSLTNGRGFYELGLNNNRLSGSIPDGLAAGRFDLSHNLLSGDLPERWVGHFFEVFGIGYNCFDTSPGSQVQTVLAEMAAADFWNRTYTASPQNPECPNAIAGDLDGDGCVDLDDLGMLLLQIRAHTPNVSYDLNGDGRVDIADARFLVLHLTNPGGSPCVH